MTLGRPALVQRWMVPCWVSPRMGLVHVCKGVGTSVTVTMPSWCSATANSAALAVEGVPAADLGDFAGFFLAPGRPAEADRRERGEERDADRDSSPHRPPRGDWGGEAATGEVGRSSRDTSGHGSS